MSQDRGGAQNVPNAGGGENSPRRLPRKLGLLTPKLTIFFRISVESVKFITIKVLGWFGLLLPIQHQSETSSVVTSCGSRPPIIKGNHQQGPCIRGHHIIIRSRRSIIGEETSDINKDDGENKKGHRQTSRAGTQQQKDTKTTGTSSITF